MQNMELEKVLEVTKHAQENRKDLVVKSEAVSARLYDPTQSLRLHVNEIQDVGGDVEFVSDVGNYELTEYAHSQLATKMGIPQKYYDRMRSEGEYTLLASNINTWMEHEKDKKRMIRILDGNIRAIVSSRFRCLDNYDVMLQALDRLKNENCEIKQSYISETNLYLKAVTPSIQEEVKVGDVVQQGIVIRNSEVGAGALRIEPMIWRLSCANGLISARALKEVHVGADRNLGDIWSDETKAADNEATWLKVRDMIDATFNGTFMEEFLKQARESTEIKFEKPVAVVDNVSSHFNMTDKQREDVLNHFLNSADPTLWGLTNSITSTAKDQENIDQQIRLEEIGYKTLIEIPKNVRRFDIDLKEGVDQ